MTPDSLDAMLRRWIAGRDFSGAVLLKQAGEVVFEACYGYADRANRVEIRPGTRFGLASVTKLFTACVVADLVAAGRLGFHDAVADVLPEHRRPGALGPDVTVHHLLTHTSGIADYAEEDEDSPAYLEDYASLWLDRPVQRMERPADFLPLFADLPAYRLPGERWQYSNAGYILLGLVVEEVTDRPYAEVVQERVFDRCGMSASGFFRLDEPRPDTALGYLPRGDQERPSRTNVYSVPVVGGPDGGAFSTTHDLVRFLHALEDGTLLGPVTGTVLARQEDAGDGYWCGYGVLHYPDGRFGHGGGDPGVSAIVQRWSQHDRDLVVLCNTEETAGEVRDLIVDSGFE